VKITSTRNAGIVRARADPPQEPYGEITRPTLYPTTP